MSYKCLKSDFPELKKKINRITKKLDKHGKKWNFEVLPDTVEKIQIVDMTGLENLPADQRQLKTSSIVVDVANYIFEMETLKLGNYEVIAILEHNAIENSTENLVYTIKEETVIPIKYRTVKSYCQHCNSNRKRKKTILLQDQTGKIIQVGSTCIHEYTGIDGLDIIKNYQELQAILIETVTLDYEKAGNINSKYINTIDYLAACIQLITHNGYKKEETKWQAWEIAVLDKQDPKYKTIAQKVIDYFKNKTFLEGQDFLNNIKLTLSQEYTKISGFVAYAYLAYQKQLEYDAKKQAEQEHKKQSGYVGEVGKRIEIELILKKRIAYETCYNGYSNTTCFIYLFEDAAGNIYKWSTSKFLEQELENKKVTLKGTIKDHTEYNGQKQTVITRCKVIN